MDCSTPGSSVFHYPPEFAQRKSVVVVQLLNYVQLFATPWTVAHQAPLSSTMPEFAQIHVH